MRGGMWCSCMYCVCLEHRLSISTRVPMQSLITSNQRRTLTRILSPSSMLKTSAHLPCVGFETTFWTTISVAIRTPLLLANLKAFTFRPLNQSECANPLKIISSYQHFEIPHVYKHYWLATLQVSSWCAGRAWGNHEVAFSVNSEWWSPW